MMSIWEMSNISRWKTPLLASRLSRRLNTQAQKAVREAAPMMLKGQGLYNVRTMIIHQSRPTTSRLEGRVPTHEIPRYPNLTKLSFMFVLPSADNKFHALEHSDLLLEILATRAFTYFVRSLIRVHLS